MKELGERLKALRKSKGLSQSEAAQELGVSVRSYHRYERDVLDAPVSVLNAAADYFGVSTDYLLARTDNPNPSEIAIPNAEFEAIKRDVHAEVDKLINQRFSGYLPMIQALKAAGFTLNPSGE